MFCSENRLVYEVFPLMNLMRLAELPQLGGPDLASVLDEDRPAQRRLTQSKIRSRNIAYVLSKWQKKLSSFSHD